MHRLRSLLCCALALSAALFSPALAADVPVFSVDETTTAEDVAAQYPDVAGKTLDELLAEFMEIYALNENNFAISYYNTVTEESYDFNETAMMIAASTFKLPLNLYYYEMEEAGEITADTVLTEGGATLSYIHYESLVNSNNELSIAMLYRLGDFRTYKTCMRKYFTMTDDEIEDKYYYDNYYCTRMMMDTLKYLYAREDEFREMIDYMKQGCPGAYFQSYLKDTIEVAHKYGSFEGAENDTGIFYADQPFLLAVYTQNVGELAVADAAKLLYDYTEYQYSMSELDRIAQEKAEAARLAAEEEEARRLAEAQAEAERLAEEQARAEAEQAAAQAESERIAAEEAQRAEAERLAKEQEEAAKREQIAQSGSFEWWMLAVALGVFLAGGGAVLLFKRGSRRYTGKYVKK